MTREEAIVLLDNLIGMVEDNHENDYDEAIRMAIRSLEAWDSCIFDTDYGQQLFNYYPSCGESMERESE